MNGDSGNSRSLAPATSEEARQIMEEAADRREAIYPVGGGTALEELLPEPRSGIDLSLKGLDRVVEFSPRDLTITVEAGVTLAKLAQTVDEAGLLFPFASELDSDSTIGGLLATAWNGPRRTGWGNLRDYVIGIRAIDGRGVAFKSGGKVVKNVAGYDLCKLLVGSRGTLGIITEATLRLKPKPEAEWLAVLNPTEGQSLAKVCEELRSPEVPYSVCDVSYTGNSGRALAARDCVVFLGWEGAAEEIEVAKRQVDAWIRSGRYRWAEGFAFEERRPISGRSNESTGSGSFGIRIQAPPTVLLRAVSVSSLMRFLIEEGPSIALQPRVGHGRFLCPRLRSAEVATRTLAELRNEIGDEGYVSVLYDRLGLTPTRELRFGRPSAPSFLMDRVKEVMDPHGILNPGRYVFANASRASVDVA